MFKTRSQILPSYLKTKAKPFALPAEFDAYKLSLWDISLKNYFLLPGQFPWLLLQMGELMSSKASTTKNRGKTFYKRESFAAEKQNYYTQKRRRKREEGSFACGSKDSITITLKNDGETSEPLKPQFSSRNPKPRDSSQACV